MRILVLTDHGNHSAENSLYGLSKSIANHPDVQLVHVASRNTRGNKAFFEAKISSELWVRVVDEEFDYDLSTGDWSAETSKCENENYDAVFLRMPPPLEGRFADFLIKRFPGSIILNNPAGIRKTSDKKYLLNFPDVCPPMKWVNSKQEIIEMQKKYPIILKPLFGHGGKGIVKIDSGKVDDGLRLQNLENYLNEISFEIKNSGFLAMKFLKNVSEGDKRIIVVGDEIIGSSLRVPAEGSWICNVARGGQSISTSTSSEDKEIVSKVHPKLKAEGIFIYGLDTLVNDNGRRILSEINSTSIGGMKQLENQSGIPVLERIADLFVKHVKQNQIERNKDH